MRSWKAAVKACTSRAPSRSIRSHSAVTSEPSPVAPRAVFAVPPPWPPEGMAGWFSRARVSMTEARNWRRRISSAPR